MTAKESHRMARLEVENRQLREQLAKAMDIYRDQTTELIELRTRLELVVLSVGVERSEL